MPTTIEFNQNDFFYNNINTPIKFDPELCSLSDQSLNDIIINALKLTDISYGQLEGSDQIPGQCTFRKVKPGDTNSATSWKMEYSIDKKTGKQTCNCIRIPNDKDKNTVISWKNSGSNLASIQGSTYAGSVSDISNSYTCMSSLPVTINNPKMNNISVDISSQKQLVSSTVNYYKSACANYQKSNILLNTVSSKDENDLKYSDTKTYYNREYLNRINLGLGILATCGIIYFTVTSSSSTSTTISNTIPNTI